MNLPNMEIVKDKPVQRREIGLLGGGPRGGFDFVPSFVKSTTSRGHAGGMSKRPSKSKDPPKMVRVIKIPSFSQDVELHRAENAWTPGLKKKAGADQAADAERTETDELEDLRKKVRSILNK